MRAQGIALCCVVLCLLLVAPPAGADLVGPVKWSQLPEMGQYGYNWSSETTVGSMVADDYLCVDPFAVIDLHWWGSYYMPGVLYPYPNSDNMPDPTIDDDLPPGILQGFNIEFYKDVPAGEDPLMPWSHPGALLYEEFIDITEVAEAYYGTVVHIGGIEENVWQYNADLPVPFRQGDYPDPQDIDGDGIDDGTVFWLKIQAVHDDPVIQWGWHEADLDELWHDNAVQHWPPSSSSPYWKLVEDKDMAFELSIVPEPSLLLAGLFGLLALLKRRR